MTIRQFHLSAIAAAAGTFVQSLLTRPGMTVGMNAGGTANWTTSKPFANLMFYARKWSPVSATPTALAADAGQQQGLLTTTLQTDEFTTTLCDLPVSSGRPIPSGTYVVLNPDALTVRLYSTDGGDLVAWTNATRITFNYSGGRLAVSVRGSVTANNGNLAVLMPGHEAPWLAGNIWNQAFLDFYSSGGFKFIRAMDLLNTMWHNAAEWSERSLPGKITIHPRTSGNSQGITPWEYLIDLAARLNLPLMINPPVRASVSYMNSLATLFAQTYPSNLQLLIEGIGNEIWNDAVGFAACSSWVKYADFTRFSGTLDHATGIATYVNHGMATGDKILGFQDLSDYGITGNGNTDPHWYAASYGQELIVDVLDANRFQMRYSASTQVPKPLLTFATYPKTTILFVKMGEAGKTANMDLNYSILSMRNWAIFDAALSRDRCVHILGTQAAQPNMTAARLSVAGAASATDAVAIAPYFGGSVFGIKLTPVAGGVTPSLYLSSVLGQATANAYCAAFPTGVTPRPDEVKAAATSTLLSFPMGGTAYVSMPTISATDGQQLNLWVTAKSGAKDHVLMGTVTVGAGQPAVEVQPTFAEHADVVREYVMTTVADTIKAQRLAIDGISPAIKLINYECGSHNNIKPPTALLTWHTLFMKSPENGAILKEYLSYMRPWIKLAGWFSDVAVDNAEVTCWGLAATHNSSDWSVDNRFLGLQSIAGYIDASTTLQVEALGTLPAIKTNPGGVYKVADLPVDASHYIHAGNAKGIYSISGNALMLDTSKVTAWDSIQNTDIVVHGIVPGAKIGRKFLTIQTGDAWYPADSLFAWSSITDTDAAVIDAGIGGALPKLSAGAASIAGGMWDMDSAVYGSSSGLLSSLEPKKPILIAAVMDTDNHTTVYVPVLTVGGGQNVRFEYGGTVSTAFRAYVTASTGQGYATFPTRPAGAHVLWVYCDGVNAIRCGVDQTEGTPGSLDMTTAVTMHRAVYVGSNGLTPRSSMKHGSMLVLNRTGLTLAEAKAMVAKMQTLHSIA